MDIKLIDGAMGAAMYVSYYVNKAEPQMLRNELSMLIRDVLDKDEWMSCYIRLLRIGCCVLRTRQQNAHEESYKLLNLDLVTMSCKVVYLNTNEPDKRFIVLKLKSERHCLSPDSTDVFVPALIQHYHNRPPTLENCCLFSVARWYSVVKLTKYKQMNYRIKDCAMYARKGAFPYVIRLQKVSTESNSYMYSLMLLAIPHRWIWIDARF